jgi:hypothetical protein
MLANQKRRSRANSNEEPYTQQDSLLLKTSSENMKIPIMEHPNETSFEDIDISLRDVHSDNLENIANFSFSEPYPPNYKQKKSIPRQTGLLSD